MPKTYQFFVNLVFFNCVDPKLCEMHRVTTQISISFAIVTYNDGCCPTFDVTSSSSNNLAN